MSKSLAMILSMVATASADCIASSCTVCLSGTTGSTCGWCAVNTTTATSVGPQCVDLHAQFDCKIQFQTETCTQGWKCGTTANNASQCVPAVGGISDKKTCDAGCGKPPPPPTPPKPTPPSPPKNQTAYTCDATTFTCAKAPKGTGGDPTMGDCQSHCKQAYTCDVATETCSKSSFNATGQKYFDNATCATACTAKPIPVPYEMRGIWRGLAIHNAYSTGEWVADITNDTVQIWYPDAASSAYKVYMKGNASATGINGHYIIHVDSTEGKLMGKIDFLAADYSMNPEVSNFIQFAIDETHLTQAVTSFDVAMSTTTVLSFETCPAGGVSPPPPPPPTPPPCKAKLDVVVIVDGSASISSPDWQSALSFVNKLVSGFAIAADQVELGVVQFSESASTVIGLSADKQAITNAVTSMVQMKLNTNTNAGFKQAKSILDTQGRPNTDGKLVIIITDGQQNSGQPAKQVADALKAQNVSVFGVGVGSGVDAKEIKSWCSLPLTDHYFSVAGFPSLEKILQKIIKAACTHPVPPPPPPPPPPTPPPCKAKLDVAVIVDGSASISSPDWQSALSFVNKLVSGFDIAADQVELGVVQFSESASTVIGLSADKTAITTAVTNMKQMKLNTNTYAGFQQAKSILDTQGRAATPKLVIIITDGQQNSGQPAKQVADALKAQNVSVFGVGVGSGVDATEIKSWCSLPLTDHYFSVAGFPSLEKILQKIIHSACPPPPFRLGGTAKNCKFHLPSALPTYMLSAPQPVSPAPVEVPAWLLPAVSNTTNGTDTCNNATTCNECIYARSQAHTCGWCSGTIEQHNATQTFQCAGRDSASTPGFTCHGSYHTTSCDGASSCGLEGLYRGLRIDNMYNFGEWSADFQPSTNTSEDVTIIQLDIAGKKVDTTQGVMTCSAKCDSGTTDKGVTFTLTTSAGQIRHGICGYSNQYQAETQGLMFAISDQGVGTPPTGFDEAMLNTSKAEVFTYYKCPKYTKTCKFNAP